MMEPRTVRTGVRVGLFSIVFCVGLCVPPSSADSITYSDTFEGSSIDAFWTVTQQNGTVSTSTAQAHTGTQSVAFSSTSGGQREMHLTHAFGSLLTGNASIWFYDAAPGQETLYEQFNLTNSIDSTVFSIGTMDFDANCYEARIGNQGPNASCGSIPQASTTNVPRTLGWHLLEISVMPGIASLSIDNVQVFASLGNYSFDGIDISMSGPDFRPDTTAYWDDFNLTAQDESVPVPEPATILLVGSGLIALGLERHRRQR